MQVTSRHHLRSDAVSDLQDAVAEQFGVAVEGDSYELVEFEDDEGLVVVDGLPAAMYVDGEPTLTVRGANEFPPTSRTVVVDAGAISFVSDGADVMRPGIVEADDAVEEGDLVVVTEESHGKALAVGRALVDGAEMAGDSGRVVESLHHVGDERYEFVP
jgi:PUA domain protein